jgi:metallo-beta-lactamase family protein
MRIAFFGATQTVTGSRYLLTCGSRQLLVDCGLFQGYKHLRLKNWARLPFNVRELDGVILTHAHLDHSGFLPVLIKQGYRGPVYATPATIELCRILFPDSGHLQEEQAEFANRHGFSRHSPALPLYTEADAVNALERLSPVDFEHPWAVGSDVSVRFTRAGHLPGAASVRVEHGSRSILFSGDLGRPHDPLMLPPAAPERADCVVIESTYGDRVHGSCDPQLQLRDHIRRVHERRGVIVVPTFAVGRAQLLLLLIARLKLAQEIPDLPVYLDSPMAIDATEMLLRFRSEHRLSEFEALAIGQVATLTRTPDQSRALDALREPAIILSASGMATGGRVLHHLKVFGTDSRNLILFAGFQAGGTRGAALVGGARDVRIHGQSYPVRAEVAQLESASAHADANELIGWLKQMDGNPRQIFITHGEAAASDALRRRIQTELGCQATVPEYRDAVDL